ncbi:MAG: type II toxin-antitoxin system prevent-host-death family antitoxin [Syntrophobacteraceae bacterium]
MTRKTINVAEAKKHLSELLGRVAYGGEQIVITKRGKPMARLVPATLESQHLAEAKGWLDDEDDFFEFIDRIVEERETHIPRVFRGQVKQ